MTIGWNDDLAVGNDLIDQQHKEFIETFTQLLTACRSHTAADAVPRVMHYLDDYLSFHFREEEHLMRSRGYPQMPDHVEQHSAFIVRVRELKREYDETGASLQVITHLNDTLLQWFLQHIRKYDKAFAAFLRDAETTSGNSR